MHTHTYDSKYDVTGKLPATELNVVGASQRAELNGIPAVAIDETNLLGIAWAWLGMILVW